MSSAWSALTSLGAPQAAVGRIYAVYDFGFGALRFWRVVRVVAGVSGLFCRACSNSLLQLDREGWTEQLEGRHRFGDGRHGPRLVLSRCFLT